MISSLKGDIVEIGETSLVIDVMGIGFLVNVNSRTIKDIEVGQSYLMQVSAVLSSDNLSIYGFLEKSYRDLFLILKKTSGIGPKSALSILDVLSLEEVYRAIKSKNAESFRQVSGIGKKSAAKLLIDLSDQLEKGKLPPLMDRIGANISNVAITASGHKLEKELKSALINQGYSERDILRVWQTVFSHEDSFETNFKNFLSAFN
ncbi:MAG: Holliday junction branch migration protein RuvA [SAR324 cluster bacterium]|nr:Holliday junction branch migration protein RuvA [SAR324 cluster bacterium]